MISGKILRDAIISGANNINNQRSRVDELEDEVKFLKSIVRQMNDEIQQLKKAI